MALSTLLVLLTQAWIAGCFRLETRANEGSSHENLMLGIRHEPEPTTAVDSSTSASSTSLEPGIDLSPEAEVLEVTTKEPEAASLADDATEVAVAPTSAPEEPDEASLSGADAEDAFAPTSTPEEPEEAFLADSAAEVARAPTSTPEEEASLADAAAEDAVAPNSAPDELEEAPLADAAAEDAVAPTSAPDEVGDASLADAAAEDKVAPTSAPEEPEEASLADAAGEDAVPPSSAPEEPAEASRDDAAIEDSEASLTDATAGETAAPISAPESDPITLPSSAPTSSSTSELSQSPTSSLTSAPTLVLPPADTEATTSEGTLTSTLSPTSAITNASTPATASEPTGVSATASALHSVMLNKGILEAPSKTSEMPQLESKPQYQEKSSADAHDSGIISVFNVRPGQNWTKVRDALKAALPSEGSLLFVSEVDGKQRCFCVTAPFQGDMEFFESLELHIAGAKLKPELCRGDLLQEALNLLPKHIRERRENDTPKRPRERNKPMIASTQQFVSVGALRSRAKEVVRSPGFGEHLNPAGSIATLTKAAHFDPAKALERMHAVLYDQVTRASKPLEKYERTSWAAAEIVKRTVRYMYNSLKRDELLSMDILEACDDLVKSAMGSYESNFGEKEWFFKLDLAPAFASAAWELFKGQDGIKFEVVESKIRASFEDFMDTIILDRAMWQATRKVFKTDAIHSKVFAALQKANRPAFDAAMEEVKPGHDMERVQRFLKRWINDSMTKAWNCLPDPENHLTVSSVSELFQHLLAPFGPDDPFSTIPSVFTAQLGPPPRNWAVVNDEVKALFNSWRRDTGRDQSGKKKGKSRG